MEFYYTILFFIVCNFNSIFFFFGKEKLTSSSELFVKALAHVHSADDRFYYEISAQGGDKKRPRPVRKTYTERVRAAVLRSAGTNSIPFARLKNRSVLSATGRVEIKL